MPAPGARLARRLAGSAVLRSVALVGGASAAAQLLGLLATPLLTRVYDQEAFGRFGLFFALANVLAVFTTFGLHDAVIAPRRDREAGALLLAGAAAAALAALPLGLAAHGLIALDLLGLGALPAWSAPLLAAEAAAIGAAMLLQLWLVRRRRFGDLAAAHLALGGARASAQAGLGLLGAGYAGLALGEVLARCAAAAGMAFRARGDLREAARATPPREAAAAAWRHRRFPLYRTASALANNVGTALPPVLVTMAHGPAAAGLFTLAQAVLAAPVGLAQKAVGDVFLGDFAARFGADPEAARRFLLKAALALAAAAAPPCAALPLLAPDLFALAFGAPWRGAGALAAIAAPLLLAELVVAPLSTALNVANRVGAKLLFDAARIAGPVLAYLLATSRGDGLEAMAATMAWSGVGAYALYAGLIYHGVSNPLADPEATAVPAPAAGGGGGGLTPGPRATGG